ncbi:MAG: hypothetical protein AMXMBFR61_17380 [Fimbriimonadales bacterium]
MGRPASVRVLFTNDLHGKLSDAGAEYLARLKAERSGTLLLDSGDAIRTGNIGIPLRPEPVWQRMEVADYDALTLGNREFHVTEGGLRAKLKGAPMPVLCANMYVQRPEEPRLAPYVLLRVGERTVGVLGLSVPMVTPRMVASALSNFLFEDPLASAARFAPELRAKCDVLVALTHVGLKVDRKLAGAGLGFDLIVGGHSHDVLERPEAVDGVPIVQAGSHGRFVGEVVLSLSPSPRLSSYRLLPLS